MARPAWLGGQFQRAFTASAAKIQQGKSEYAQRRALRWQNQALAHYDLVPELHYASQFIARMLSKVRIFPALLTDDVEHPEPITEGLPVEILDRIQDPGGGRAQILENYGRLVFITGEGYLLGRGLQTDMERWSFVWKDELEFNRRGSSTSIIHKPVDDQEKEEYGPGEAIAYRMWTPHPRRSGVADSPMHAVLDIAEELIILTKSVHATATSRLAKGGILALPQEIAPPPAEALGDEDPLNDPFLADFIDHISGQIANPSSAEATAPYVLWAAAEYLQAIRHISTHDPQTDYVERDLRKEAIQRLGYGLDMPPEALTGFAQANHWSSYAIQDSMWNDHGAPKAHQFCSDLNEVYLRPALQEAGYGDWRRVVVGYDATAVVVNPDRSDDANEAWDRGAISYSAYRQLKNIPEDAAQPPEEHKEWLLLKSRGQSSAAQAQPQAGQGQPLAGPENVSREQARQEGARTSSAAMELGAAQLALLRSRELAGVRLRQEKYRKRCPECLERMNGYPNALVAAKIGQDAFGRFGITDVRELVKGGADGFKDLLLEWGYSETQTLALCEMVEGHAARTLFEERTPEMPAGFAAHLERTKSVL